MKLLRAFLSSVHAARTASTPMCSLLPPRVTFFFGWSLRVTGDRGDMQRLALRWSFWSFET